MAGGYGKIHLHPKTNTNGFIQNPDNINKSGRPHNIVKRMQQKYGIPKMTPKQAKDIVAVCLHANEDEIMEIINDEHAEILAKIVCRSIQRAKSYGSWGAVKDIVEIIVGKASQDINIVERVDLDRLSDQFSDEELKAIQETASKLIIEDE